ncbi:bolA-like protein 3 [Watersipora subatra]|uniref:bolA-like protein 3 n=1 Tax=Watersipora subatra TaxID=2589382 RepID=UPI00355C489F
MSGWARVNPFLSRISPIVLRSVQEHKGLISHFPSLRCLPPTRLNIRSISAQRSYATLTAGEQKIYDAVIKGFPSASFIKVEDISGGCGAMFDVIIESTEFQGKKLVQQHMMVNRVLKLEIADMHGIRITTKASAS